MRQGISPADIERSKALRAEGKSWVDVGRVIRHERKVSSRAAMRIAHGWTQEQAAEEWNQRWPEDSKAAKDFSYWERWPTSEKVRRPTLKLLTRLAVLYECGLDDLLADVDYSTLATTAMSASPDTLSTEPVSSADGQLAAHRRPGPPPDGTSMGHLGAGGAAHEDHAPDLAATVLSMFGPRDPDLADRVRTVRSGEARLDAETLGGLAQVTTGFRRAYRSAGAATLLGPAHGTLRLLVDLAPDAGADQQDEIVSMIGQLAGLIGTVLMLDIGDFPAARPYFAITARAGQQLESDELTALAMGCRAFHSTYSGQLGEGLAFADGAMEIAARGIAHRTHGWLAAVASEMHATHPHDRECGQLLDQAARQLELAEDEDWLGIGAFNPDKLTAYRGGDLVRLGRYRDAQEHLHAALVQLDPALKKHRATACIDLADAYALDGRIDDAAHHALAALDIVAGTRHAASLRRVEELHRSLVATQTATVRQLGVKILELKAAS